AASGGLGDAFLVKVGMSPSGTGSLLYACFLGGSDTDLGYGVAVDGAGNAYLTGQTYSADFPTTPGAFRPVCGGCPQYSGQPYSRSEERRVGTAALPYGGFLRGGDDDRGPGVAVGGAGHARPPRSPHI